MKFEKLLSPIRIGTMEVKNRFVMPPMGSSLAAPDGTLNERYVQYMAERARGGFGLVMMEVTAIDKNGICILSEPGIWDDKFIPGIKRLADLVHQYGARLATQLHHGGREAIAADVRAVGPSPLKSLAPFASIVPTNTPRELTIDEIWDLIKKYGDGALRAKKAGVDAVEVHGGHQYLVAQFMSPYSNKRTDEFGGSFENRMRFPVEIIKNIREKTGDDYPVIFRMSGEERVFGGRTIDQSRMVARYLEEAGADAIHVTVGTAPSAIAMVAPASYPEGHLLPYAAAIKSAVSIPVIAVGRIHEPLLAETALQDGMADLISFGRQSIADPEFPRKVEEGRLSEICPCTSCLQGCIGRLLDPAYGWVTCLMNPFAGREWEWKITPADKKKKIVVAGGGPGGLETAWLAASRGHDVTLYEKSGKLGGQFIPACMPPSKQTLAKSINFWREMCKKYNVNVKLNTEATPELIEKEKPDTVVIATGGEPLVPDIKGIMEAGAVCSWEVLRGDIAVGMKVLIVGGGMVGCETADYLALQGHIVSIVEMLPELAVDMQPWPRSELLKRIREYGICAETGAVVKEITRDGAIAERNGEKLALQGFDTVIMACGSKSVNTLEEELKGKVKELYVIGDAKKARKAIEAIEEAAQLAIRL